MAKKLFNFSKDAWGYNDRRLTNQIFKMLPMYENEEDWEKQLDTVIYDLRGYNEIFVDNGNFMTLIAKLLSLKSAENKFVFRKIIFEAITALKEVMV